MKYALKEWDTVVEALGKGKVIAMWRKGGISDTPSVKQPHESFHIEQKQFLLFPTYTHESLDKIKKDYWLVGKEYKGPNKDNQIRIKYWAEVEETIILENINELINISSELVNTNEHLVSSWNLYPNHKGKILFLRVYILTNPVLITYSKEYAGCKSWVELNINIPKIGSRPILSFKDFSYKVRYTKALLEEPSFDRSRDLAYNVSTVKS